MAYPRLMMTNRNIKNADELGIDVADMTFWQHKSGSLKKLSSWTKLDADAFVELLKNIGASFPPIPEERNEDQRHISVFVHGFNNDWKESVDRYDQIKTDMYDENELGALVLFSWPSNGSVAGYLPDREDARASAPAFATVLAGLYAHLIAMQKVAAGQNDPTKCCRAKISIIAHSMGNYVVQKALAIAAKQLNSPQLITLVTQLAMVAADVDNDIFQTDKPNDSDGSLMANLCYRISALYSGLDQVLGASAGLKHFGTRRLGRSGLEDAAHVWPNVWDLDVSDAVRNVKNTHSGVFDSPKGMTILEQILRGVDRDHVKMPKQKKVA